MAVTAPVAGYARSFDARLAAVLPGVAARSPELAGRLRAAGMRPEELTSAAAVARLPVLTKDELVELQARDPPFGGLLREGARPRRVFQSPGPLYEPEPDAADPWRWAPALRAAGFGPGQVVLNAFGYHLSPAGAMFEEGARAVGCTVVPAGVGGADLQVAACLDLGVSGYVGLPSWLKALLEKLEERAPEAPPLQRAFVTAEPLPDELRAWLRRRVPTVRQGYGTAETGNLGYECEAEAGWHVPDDALVEVCDEDGRPLGPGERGEVVATLLRDDYPLVRFGTGDLSSWVGGPCSCGRATPRLAGWQGRTGAAVKVRGMFLHPRQVRAVMADVRGVAGYRFVVGREADRDTLRCELALAPEGDAGAAVADARERIRSGLRFNAAVEVVDAVAGDGPVVVDERAAP
ncbi:MAG TPA: AMP-binding protein [Solirubrobacteraceae bacterium]|jgi:phenylacetate-CoA ligase|nr:AMP-binding protein [Solirubrobacteraceae bacterium]